MGKRPAVLAAAAFLPGIWTGYYLKIGAAGKILLSLIFFICVILFLSAFLIKRMRISKRLAIVTCLFIIGLFRANQSQNDWDQLQSYLSSGQEMYVAGTIYRKEVKTLGNIIYLKQISFQDKSAPVTSYSIQTNLDAEAYSIGQTLYIKGSVLPFSRAANEGGFDENSFYRGQNIGFRVLPQKVISVGGRENYAAEALYRFRRRLFHIYTKQMGDSAGGLMSSMLLGEKELLSPENRELFQKAGIAHVLAISGLHISILGMFCFRIFRRILTGVLPAVLSGGLIFYYVGMTGFSISSVRAALMFFVFLYAQYRGRSYDMLSSLSITGMILVWDSPAVLFQVGFLLSVAAVFGVAATLILQNNNRNKEENKKKSRIVGETLSLSLGIQIMTAPLTAWFFYEIPVYSILWNLAVLPSMGLLVFLGLTGGLLTLFFPGIAGYLLAPSMLQIFILQRGSEWITKLPQSMWITGRPSIFWMIIWYSLVLVLLLYLYGTKRKRRWMKPLFLCVFMILLLLPKTGGSEISVLDVGQGDGIYIRTESKESLFIDGGSSSNRKLGKFTILPFLKFKGIRTVHYWFISHADADHINGFVQTVESGYRIQNLVVSRYMLQDKAYDVLMKLAERNKIRVLKMRPGDRIASNKDKTWSIQCIYPDRRVSSNDRNARSLTLLYRQNKYLALFAGDLAVEDENRMIRLHTLGQVDLFKSSHHGSNYSNGENLLAQIRPKITVISCGIRNNYGHPGKDALERLRRLGEDIYLTMDSGQVTVNINGVKAYRR